MPGKIRGRGAWRANMPRSLSVSSFLVASLLFCFCLPCRGTDTRVRFVQITDTHFGDNDHLDRLKKTVASVNALPLRIDCIVHTGDITNENIESDAIVRAGLAVLGRMKAPVHFLPGNHDILPRRLEATVSAYRKHFGELSAKAEYGGVVFLFVYTEPFRKGFAIKGYDALRWLETELRDAGKKPVLVFTHAPPADDLYGGVVHKGWEERAGRLVTLLNEYRVKAVFAGHFHRDEMHWIGDVPLYVAPAIAGYWGRQAAYRVYEYDNGRIEYSTQYIE